VRVGVVTAFFNNHSVWKTPVRGWIENIDRSRFEIHGYYTGIRRTARPSLHVAHASNSLKACRSMRWRRRFAAIRCTC